MTMRPIWAASALFAFATSAFGQDMLGRQAVVPVGKPTAIGMTHEETIVRTAYTKFAYASEQGAIGELALEASGNPVPREYSEFTSDQRLSAARVSQAQRLHCRTSERCHQPEGNRPDLSSHRRDAHSRYASSLGLRLRGKYDLVLSPASLASSQRDIARSAHGHAWASA
jgi:hypothetical protein